MKTGSQTVGQSSRRRLPAAIQPHDPVWRRWAAIATLLAADLAGLEGAHEIALAIAIYQALTGLADDRTPRFFRSRVRFTYVCVMALSFIPSIGFIVWIQMLGTFAVVLTGYCPLARAMALLPGNRSVDLSWDLVRLVVRFPVSEGSIVKELEERQRILGILAFLLDPPAQRRKANTEISGNLLAGKPTRQCDPNRLSAELRARS